MKTTPWIKLCKGAALALAVSYGLTYCHTTKSKLTLEQKGDSLTVIHITYPANYILLPIEEEAMESQVLLDTGEATDTDMDIRLAQTKVDYFVPLALPAGAKITKNLIKDLGLPKGTTIGGMIRNGEGVLVTGDTLIRPGDHVVVFCLSMMIKKIEKFFN